MNTDLAAVGIDRLEEGSGLLGVQLRAAVDFRHAYCLSLIHVDDIRHIGDVAIYSLATGVGPQENAMDALVRQYWNRTICKSAVEILVTKATVRRKLFDVSEK
ncbi:hypothetical protein [Bradyrhizobium elkanii]